MNVLEKIRSVIDGLKLKRKNIVVESVYFDPDCLGGCVDKILWIERNIAEIKKFLVNERNFDAIEADFVIKFINKPFKVDYILKNDGNLDDLASNLRLLYIC